MPEHKRREQAILKYLAQAKWPKITSSVGGGHLWEDIKLRPARYGALMGAMHRLEAGGFIRCDKSRGQSYRWEITDKGRARAAR